MDLGGNRIARAIVINNWIFLDARTEFDPVTNKYADEVKTLRENVFRNIAAALTKVGSSLDHLVRVSIFSVMRTISNAPPDHPQAWQPRTPCRYHRDSAIGRAQHESENQAHRSQAIGAMLPPPLRCGTVPTRRPRGLNV